MAAMFLCQQKIVPPYTKPCQAFVSGLYAKLSQLSGVNAFI